MLEQASSGLRWRPGWRETGLRVTLLDQDEPGRATSRWSFAWINSNDKGPRHYHDLNHAGISAWAELAPSTSTAMPGTGPSGHVELATAEAAAELEARVKRLTDWGYPARLLDPAEVTAAGAVVPSAGRRRPPRSSPVRATC